VRFRVIIGRTIDLQATAFTRGTSMGRGDKRTRKGKIFKGSYGKSRPHKVKKKASATGAKSAGRKGA